MFSRWKAKWDSRKTLPKPFNIFVQTPKLNSHTDAKQIFALNLKAQGGDHVIWLPDQCEGFHIQNRLSEGFSEWSD